MNRTWKKIKSLIGNKLNPREEKDYLNQLIENLKEYQTNNKSLTFRIKSANQKGFVVKVGGLFAFISYYYMPWKYKRYEDWLAVSNHLIGKQFTCKISSINEKERPVQIRINATNHPFEKTIFYELEQYECVVINKTKYGLFVDLGYHFDWKHGSFVGLIHNSAFKNNGSLVRAEPGDIVKTYFHGFIKQEKLKKNVFILGDKSAAKETHTNELEHLVGTSQTAIVMEDKNGKKAFFIEGKYKTIIQINEENFPDKKRIKNKLKNLNLNSTVNCKILRISKKENLISELLAVETEQVNG